MFVDTNILIYAYDRNEGIKHRVAVELLEDLEAQSLGVVSTQVLGEFFTNVIRKIEVPMSVFEAQSSMLRFTESWTVLPVTQEEVLEGVRGVIDYQMQYWDAVIWATAKLNGIQTIITEDFSHDREVEGVRFINPFR